MSSRVDASTGSKNYKSEIDAKSTAASDKKSESSKPADKKTGSAAAAALSSRTLSVTAAGPSTMSVSSITPIASSAGAAPPLSEGVTASLETIDALVGDAGRLRVSTRKGEGTAAAIATGELMGEVSVERAMLNSTEQNMNRRIAALEEIQAKAIALATSSKPRTGDFERLEADAQVAFAAIQEQQQANRLIRAPIKDAALQVDPSALKKAKAQSFVAMQVYIEATKSIYGYVQIRFNDAERANRLQPNPALMKTITALMEQARLLKEQAVKSEAGRASMEPSENVTVLQPAYNLAQDQYTAIMDVYEQLNLKVVAIEAAAGIELRVVKVLDQCNEYLESLKTAYEKAVNIREELQDYIGLFEEQEKEKAIRTVDDVFALTDRKIGVINLITFASRRIMEDANAEITKWKANLDDAGKKKILTAIEACEVKLRLQVKGDPNQGVVGAETHYLILENAYKITDVIIQAAKKMVEFNTTLQFLREAKMTDSQVDEYHKLMQGVDDMNRLSNNILNAITFEEATAAFKAWYKAEVPVKEFARKLNPHRTFQKPAGS
jgi:hypothetical protein